MLGSTERTWQNFSAQYRSSHCSCNSKKQCKPQTNTNEYTSSKESWAESELQLYTKKVQIYTEWAYLQALAYKLESLHAVQAAVVSSSRILVTQQTVTQTTAFRFCMFCLSASNLSQGDCNGIFYLIHQDLNLRLSFPNRSNICYSTTKDQILLSFLKVNFRWFHDPVCS